MPTRDTAWPHGTPCWVDYAAADVDAAKAFYARVLGWDYTGGDPEYGGYVTCETGGRAAAGLAPRMDPAKEPTWTTYFAADEADAVATRVTDAGGQIALGPMDVGPMGRMVIAVDPQGNEFGVWQAGLHTGAQIYNEPGALVWNEAAVEDPKAAQEFYAAVFGFTFTEIEGWDGYATFGFDRPLGGLSARRTEAPGGWTTSFSVRSVDDTVAAVEAGGGKVVIPAIDMDFGRFAVVADPWGAPFSVLQELDTTS